MCCVSDSAIPAVRGKGKYPFSLGASILTRWGEETNKLCEKVINTLKVNKAEKRGEKSGEEGTNGWTGLTEKVVSEWG